jgi:hypothetical protein
MTQQTIHHPTVTHLCASASLCGLCGKQFIPSLLTDGSAHALLCPPPYFRRVVSIHPEKATRNFSTN